MKKSIEPNREKPCLRGFPTSPGTNGVDQLPENGWRNEISDEGIRVIMLHLYQKQSHLCVRICRFSFDMGSFLSKR